MDPYFSLPQNPIQNLNPQNSWSNSAPFYPQNMVNIDQRTMQSSPQMGLPASPRQRREGRHYVDKASVLRKTELCANILKTGFCSFGKNCNHILFFFPLTPFPFFFLKENRFIVFCLLKPSFFGGDWSHPHIQSVFVFCVWERGHIFSNTSGITQRFSHKTLFCFFFLFIIILKKGDNCRFAHSAEELRVVSLEDKLKFGLLTWDMYTKHRTQPCEKHLSSQGWVFPSFSLFFLFS